MNRSIALGYNKDVISGKGATALIGVAFFALATALGAYVRIPVPGSPVPITLQTFFVLLSGAVLGRRLGAASQLAYILLGACGLPIFQGAASGLAYLAGPTGGYLVGFFAASWIVGAITRPTGAGIARYAAAFTAGCLVIYACGAAWLACLCGLDPAHALSAGVLPFVPGDVAKVSLASLISARIAGRSRELF